MPKPARRTLFVLLAVRLIFALPLKTLDGQAGPESSASGSAETDGRGIIDPNG